MGLFDSILGRTKPVEAKLDNLFALTNAAITLDIAAGLASTGRAGVCFKPPADREEAAATAEINGLLGLDDPAGSAAAITSVDDQYGYRWFVVNEAEISTLVATIHLINSTLQDHGWGPQLLCSAFGFTPTPKADATAKAVTLVYLFKRGTYYPFCPTGPEARDNAYELSVAALVGADLPKEQDLTRWMALWGNPISS